MKKDGLSFQVCKMPEDSESIKNDRQAVLDGLVKFNKNKVGNMEPPEAISIFMRDRKSKVIGGVVGYAYAGWLHIDLLWIEESFRKKGNGSKLLKMAENEAVKHGCKHVDLDTFSFQARPFYEKHGYTLFATLDNYLEGHSKYFLKKDLQRFGLGLR